MYLHNLVLYIDDVTRTLLKRGRVFTVIIKTITICTISYLKKLYFLSFMGVGGLFLILLPMLKYHKLERELHKFVGTKYYY
jgi:hypothetical protein